MAILIRATLQIPLKNSSTYHRNHQYTSIHPVVILHIHPAIFLVSQCSDQFILHIWNDIPLEDIFSWVLFGYISDLLFFFLTLERGSIFFFSLFFLILNVNFRTHLLYTSSMIQAQKHADVEPKNKPNLIQLLQIVRLGVRNAKSFCDVACQSSILTSQAKKFLI